MRLAFNLKLNFKLSSMNESFFFSGESHRIFPKYLLLELIARSPLIIQKRILFTLSINCYMNYFGKKKWGLSNLIGKSRLKFWRNTPRTGGGGQRKRKKPIKFLPKSFSDGFASVVKFECKKTSSK